MAGRRSKKLKLCHQVPDTASPPWSDLPSEIVSLIFQYLQIPDLFRCRAVCRSWAQAKPHGPPPPQIPWMMLSLRPSSSSTSQRFFSVSDGKIHRLSLNKMASGAVCCGSFDNWLVLSHWIHGDFLLNPFKNSIIPLEYRSYLPPVIAFYYPGEELKDPFLIRKVILSKSPHDKSSDLNPCIVAAIFGRCSLVAICKLNTKRWWVLENLLHVDDIFFHGGKLHAINQQETIFRVDVGEIRKDVLAVTATKRLIIQSRFNHSYESDYIKHVYIVKSCFNGDLLMILRYLRWQEYGSKTCFFKVYQLDCKSNPNFGKWKEKESLNGEAIFVSESGSRAILASGNLGFGGNCIYFLEGRQNMRYGLGIRPCDDMGVFHMKDGSIEKFMQNRPGSSLSPPAWFFLSNDLSDY